MTEIYYTVEWYTSHWLFDPATCLPGPAGRIKTLERAKELAELLWIHDNHVSANDPPVIKRFTVQTEVIKYED